MTQQATLPEGAEGIQAALWRDLGSGDAAGLQAWLGLTVRSLPGALAAAMLLPPEPGDAAVIAANWPPADAPDPALAAAARLALERGTGLAQERPGAPSLVAYPFVIDGHAVGAVAAALARDPPRDLRPALRHLQWAAAWVRDGWRARLQAVQAAAIERQGLALELLAAALEETEFGNACRIAATELGARLGCERVGIGFVRHGRTEVSAVSFAAAFGRRLEITRLLGAAMDEAVDQRAVILYPAAAGLPLATRAAAALSAAADGSHVLVAPMAVGARFVGAATFERPANQPFEQATVQVAEAVVAILGPALLDKREIARPVMLKSLDALGKQGRRLLGPRYYGRKLAALGLVAALLLGSVVTGTYTVAAESRVEGAVQRAIVAPFDGFIREAPVRAGASIAADSLVVAMDDRDLVLQRLRWVTERQQHVNEYDDAFSKQRRAEAQRFLSQRDQADAEIKLLDEQLSRARILAPFDGIVVSGNLSQSIGAPVRRGDVLFEIAPLRDYRLELMVDESQVADVAPGQHGDVLVAALPEHRFPFTVELITPMAVPREGRMVFKVAATLDETSDRLRPGLEGVAKIDVGRARVAWIWSRSLIHWATLKLWLLP